MDEIVELEAACVALASAQAAVTARRRDRAAAIEAAFKAGVAIGAIAERSALSVSHVQRILGHPRGKVGRPKAGG